MISLMPSEPIPQVLYKYYPPARIDTLEKGWIRFSKPSAFNDTFDSYFRVPEDPKQRMERTKFLDELGVFCMAKDPDNDPMWVHYAANHTGFVVGYKTDDEAFTKGGGAVLRNVDYQDRPPSVAPPKKPEIEVTLTKSKAWEYEKEWRCVRTFGPKESRYLIFEDENISEIIIGIAMEHHHILQILNYADAARTVKGINVALSESIPVRDVWRYDHHPSAKRICTHWEGAGYIP